MNAVPSSSSLLFMCSLLCCYVHIMCNKTRMPIYYAFAYLSHVHQFCVKYYLSEHNILILNSMSHWCVKNEATSKQHYIQMQFSEHSRLAYTYHLCAIAIVTWLNILLEAKNRPNRIKYAGSFSTVCANAPLNFWINLTALHLFLVYTLFTYEIVHLVLRKRGVCVKSAWFLSIGFETMHNITVGCFPATKL